VNIAVIGAGVSGLSASWFLLKYGHKVSIYEKSNSLGGHATELEVNYIDDDRRETVKVNIAYDIFTKQTYPRYISLLEELELGIEPCNPDYSFRSLSDMNEGKEQCKLFPVFKDKRRVRQLVKKDFRRLAWFSNKLSRKAKKFMVAPDSSISFRQFLNDMKIPKDLIHGFYTPLFARPWGVKQIDMYDMPAEVILDWLNRLSILTPRPAQWYKNKGGVKNYIDQFASKLIEKGAVINTNSQILSIARTLEGVDINLQNGEIKHFDKVVMSTNAKHALNLLAPPTEEELNTLQQFKYQKNNVLIHTDKTLMPSEKKDWSYFNIVYNPGNQETFNTIHFGRDKNVPVFLTNYRKLPKEPSEKDIITKYSFEQPIFNRQAKHSQSQLKSIQGENNTWFAGSYVLGHGHHESAVESGYIVANSISKG